MEDLITDFYSKHQLKQVNILGKQREYILAGTGRTGFLLLPGGGQTAQLNFKLIKELESEYKIIAPTIYDYDSIEEFNSTISNILNKENIGEIVVYGLSIGGLLAQSYALRNQHKVKALIISHACTPSSKTYYNKVIRPLKALSVVLPLLPNIAIKQFTKKFHKLIQGGSNKLPNNLLFDDSELIVNNHFRKEFYQKYLDKRLLKTWIKLHMDFYNNESFNSDSFKNWSGKVLILRTDNDPLMQDEGDFNNVYPTSKLISFSETGHLTFYYQFNKMVKEIKKFLNDI